MPITTEDSAIAESKTGQNREFFGQIAAIATFADVLFYCNYLFHVRKDGTNSSIVLPLKNSLSVLSEDGCIKTQTYPIPI